MNKAAGDLARTSMEQWCVSSLQSSGGWEASFAPGQSVFLKASVCCVSQPSSTYSEAFGEGIFGFWNWQTLYWMLYSDSFVDLEDCQAKVQGNQRCRTGVSTLKQPQSPQSPWETSMACWQDSAIWYRETSSPFLGGWRVRVALSF